MTRTCQSCSAELESEPYELWLFSVCWWCHIEDYRYEEYWEIHV